MLRTILTTTLVVFTSIEINAAKLDVTIENIDSNIGVVRFTLLNNPDYFPNNATGKSNVTLTDGTGKTTTGIVIPAKKGKVSFTVFMPEDTYAAVAYHDKNNNKKLDKSFFFGIPSEPYGFSNNARGSFGPPDFTQATFNLPEYGASLIFDIQ